MADIRRQGIKGTIWVYVGFLLGAISTYFFTYTHWFTPDQYGLTRALLEIGLLLYAFSTLGTTFYVYKFFPYYADNLPKKDNDLLGQALKICFLGFLFSITALYLFEPIIIKKFSKNSALLVEYFYYIIPLGFFLLLYTIIEIYAFGFSKASTTIFLKEVVLKFFTLIVVLLKIIGLINFKTFVLIFSFQYAIIAIILIAILYKEGNFWLNFKPSKVTKKYKKKIIAVLALTFLTAIVSVLRTSIDALVLASRQDLGKVAIFGFTNYLVMTMGAPSRSLIAITIPMLSRHWKDKNLVEIDRIYKRTSINLLSFSLFMFGLILLNFTDAIQYFNLNESYLEGKYVFILLGLVTIIELGTGVNGQIIGTSSFFRFELWTSILLTVLIIPLSYFLTVKYGLIGPAVANLVSFTIYNAIRYFFLLKKFKMQPFSQKTIEVILIAIVAFMAMHYLLGNKSGLLIIILRSILYALLFIVAVFIRDISPDAKPVFLVLKKRIENIIFKR
ncbi:MAG: lipopolysaccharide biosynthesis protein [Ferruginibacter sp.]|nr:lipopolysaccharide biosynthesis protein [Ferruginibacter sp.]